MGGGGVLHQFKPVGSKIQADTHNRVNSFLGRPTGEASAVGDLGSEKSETRAHPRKKEKEDERLTTRWGSFYSHSGGWGGRNWPSANKKRTRWSYCTLRRN
ncbi:uncharacterized protein LY79DRAFT_407234 [Colletotrichum navitas]|uniref:Uncharacterized protein n=1 Tax=Colletotrichum navitas TaxID=681940 RepID=A0AAD8VA88_9PEZI|nr:uncharacterized protein LY79DRAFT_407234 [Colletotrichum navitas]KAK1597185.1 hypothetical protein LY79DRAFT_407234 [Colletotrichum navitas]